ncbi:aldose epimerase family protein [Luteolibacter algae]|uniref:Aldose 1-epimerase n=1 Tax=Luteolibacter algae TaxID=454151 RepID=A0ABW5DD50_9BACT
MKLSKSHFGSFNGTAADLYTLENDGGMTVKITNYGGIVTAISVPDKNGNSENIACGFDSLEGYFSDEYKANSPYFGCLVGRYAGRIKNGKFSANGKDYQVDTNDGPNHLHGGINALDKRLWEAEEFQSAGSVGLKLSITSPDGDNGYPGNLDVTVVYTLTNDNELSIDYSATCDKETPFAPTNHTYFNLSGFREKVLGHEARIISDRFLLPDDTNVPVGAEKNVASTVWDFNKAKPIGDVFEEEPKGFENYYVFSKSVGTFEKVAEFSEENSGRVMEVSSSEPGMLFYTGYYTSDSLKRNEQEVYGQFKGFCCETARYANGPNIEGSPGSMLRPGETFESRTVFKFGISTSVV